jgi:hypothetical protein
MPSVPRRDPASIRGYEAVPGVTVHGGATEETFGGGASGEKVNTALAGLSEQAVKLAIAQQESVDRTLANDISNQMVKVKNDIMVEVAQKYNNAAAVQTPDYIRQTWDERVRPMIESAPNDRVKYLLNKSGYVHKNELDHYGMNHMVKEDYRWKEQSGKDYRAVKTSEAVQSVALPNYEEITDRTVFEIVNSRVAWADQNQIPRKGTQEETAVFNAAINDDMKALYMGQIKQSIANDDFTKAKAIQEKSKKWIVGEDARDIENLLKSEVTDAQIEQNAMTLVGLGDDPAAVLAAMDTIDPAIRPKVKAEYDLKMEKIGMIWNNNSATIVDGYLRGDMKTQVQLEQGFVKGSTEPNGLDKESHALWTQWLSKEVPFGKAPNQGGDDRKKKYATLFDKYGETYDSNPIERAKKIQKWRNDVLASKPYITEQMGKDLLALSSDAVVKKTQGHNWKPFIDGIKRAAAYAAWPPLAAGDAIRMFIQKGIDANPGDLPVLERQVVNETTAQHYKDQMSMDELTNISVVKEGNLTFLTPNKSDAKSDFVVKPGEVKVRVISGKNKGRIGKVPRDKFDSKRHETIA